MTSARPGVQPAGHDDAARWRLPGLVPFAGEPPALLESPQLRPGQPPPALASAAASAGVDLRAGVAPLPSPPAAQVPKDRWMAQLVGLGARHARWHQQMAPSTHAVPAPAPRDRPPAAPAAASPDRRLAALSSTFSRLVGSAPGSSGVATFGEATPAGFATEGSATSFSLASPRPGSDALTAAGPEDAVDPERLRRALAAILRDDARLHGIHIGEAGHG